MEYRDQDRDQDLNLRPSDDTPIVLSVPAEESPAWPKLIAAGVLVVAVAATGYLVFFNRAEPATTTEPATASAPAPPTDASSPLGADVPPIDLPPLDESDDVVRGLVKELSSNPSVAAWLATDDLIRNFTVVVSNIAAGESATGRVPVLRPRSGFMVEERGEDLFINDRSYARYLPLAGHDHFSILDELADPRGRLCAALAQLATQAAKA